MDLKLGKIIIVMCCAQTVICSENCAEQKQSLMLASVPGAHFIYARKLKVVSSHHFHNDVRVSELLLPYSLYYKTLSNTRPS